MRVVMPLFEFNYGESRFQFTEKYSLERFDYEKDVPQDLAGLSKLDISQISLEHWAIVANNPNESYRAEINLLLMAFRIYTQANAFIKWRFSEEDSGNSARITSYDRFRKLAMTSSRNVEEKGLRAARDGFLNLRRVARATGCPCSEGTIGTLFFITLYDFFIL